VRFTATASADGTTARLRLLQHGVHRRRRHLLGGAAVTGVLTGGAASIGFSGTVSGATLTGSLTDGTPITATLTGATTFAGTSGALRSRAASQGCAAHNLQNTIPSPQTLSNGPTSLVAPGTISLRFRPEARHQADQPGAVAA
jgi:hypothetical protein